jgi:hypothetical protein
MTETKPTPADLIGEFVQLRDLRKAKDAEYAALRKEAYDARMEEIEAALLDQLNKDGADSIKTKKGTAYKKMSTSVTTSDSSAFTRHVIGGELWDLVDWRPNKTAINELIAAGDELPPGLNRTTFWNVNINRPKETGND